MVERTADILSMDKGEPVKQSAFMRIDGAIRRLPGLGAIIAIALLGHLYNEGNFIALVGFLGMVVFAIAQEFARPRE
jgi:hypothetical protein